MQPDGKILAGGDFTTSRRTADAATRNRIARLENDGRLDQTLNLSTVGDLVIATAVQPDGKILIGGSFTSVLGVTRNNVARLNTDGTLDTAFNPNANGHVVPFAVQADGKILVGGDFNGRTASADRRAIASPGSMPRPAWPIRSTRTRTALVMSFAVQADGKILVGGFFNGPNSIGGQMRNRIARLDPTTGLADSFDPNANAVRFFPSQCRRMARSWRAATSPASAD